MSKSRGNFYSGDQLLDEKGYAADQIRYYLALLGLSEKSSDFDFAKLDERNRFLAGPLNAAFERPISAAHSKFDGRVPDGVLLDERASATPSGWSSATSGRWTAPTTRTCSSRWRTTPASSTACSRSTSRTTTATRKKPAATPSIRAFYVLKNLMIMLYPFVPETMDRLRESLRLPPTVFRLDELGIPIPAGHAIGPKQEYSPPSRTPTLRRRRPRGGRVRVGSGSFRPRGRSL